MRLRLALAVVLIGCGNGSDPDDGVFTPDAGSFPDAQGEPTCASDVPEPAPPTLPAPVAWACPSGWRAVDGACSPWPETGRADCPEGQAHFPGSTGCEPIGTECPAEEFSEPPARYASWSRLRVPAGGDIKAAMAQVAEAGVPTVVMLAKGEYVEEPTIRLPQNTLLWGACAGDTVVRTASTSPDLDLFIYIATTSAGAALGNLTVRPNTIGVVALEDQAELTLEGVQIVSPVLIGAGAVFGGALRAERVVVRDVRPDSNQRGTGFLLQGGSMELDGVSSTGCVDHGMFLQADDTHAGRVKIARAFVAENQNEGILIRSNTTATISSSAVERNLGSGIHVEGGTLNGYDLVVSDTAYLEDLSPGIGLVVSNDGPTETIPGDARIAGAAFDRNTRWGAAVFGDDCFVGLSDVVVRDTALRLIEDDSADGAGQGIVLHANTKGRVERALLERNHNTGILAVDGARLDAWDVTINDTLPGSSTDGNAIGVLREATASISKALIERSHGAAIVSFGVAELLLSDLTVRASKVDEFGDGGVGVLVADRGTEVVIERARFEDNELYGIIAQEQGTVRLTDVAVTGTLPDRDGVLGLGLAINEGSRIEGERILLDQNTAAGVVCAKASSFEVADLIVRRTRPGRSTFDRPVGRGLSLEIGSTATITGALFDENREVAIFVDDESRLVLNDAAVRNTTPLADVSGRGLQAQSQSFVTLDGVCFENNREVGILAAFAQVFGHDVQVLGTARNVCFESGACEAAGGAGLYASIGARIALNGFLLHRNVEAGLIIEGPGENIALEGGIIDLIDGTIAFSILGADVRDPKFDQSRISVAVVYSDNEFNGVQAGTTVLPDANTDGLY